MALNEPSKDTFQSPNHQDADPNRRIKRSPDYVIPIFDKAKKQEIPG